MHGTNCCLMVLSFVLGLLLTFAFTIRRVTGEAPVSSGSASGSAAGLASAAGASAKPAGGTAPSEAATAKLAVGGAPYGDGSARAGAGGSGPSGWTIKGNEDSMLYHGPESPSYDATIAEVWFKDEATAAAAGFKRWDSWRTDEEK